MMNLLASHNFDLDTDLNKDFNISARYPISVIFTYEDADATDGTLLVNVGNLDGLTPAKSVYTLSSATNVTDAEIVGVNVVIPRVNIVYTKNSNTAGTGKISIYGGS